MKFERSLVRVSIGVLSIMQEISDIITQEGKAPDVERVREIDRRLRICKNPEKVEGSRASVHLPLSPSEQVDG